MAKEFVIKHGLIVHGEITGSDIRIDDWNSVSASLSELSSNVGETVVTASIVGNVITFTKSDGTTFDTVVQEDTGSFFTSASVDLNTITFHYGDNTSGSLDVETGTTQIRIKNTSGSPITKGTPVYITGNVGNTDMLQIAPADASDITKMPAVGLLLTDLGTNGEGYVVQGGYLKGLVTDTIDGTSTTSNDTVYVKAGGGLTMTKPTGDTNYIQNIAKVARVHGSSGSLIVSSILRTNDVPNLPTGKIWVGDGNTVTSSFVHLDETNQRLGINTDTPASALHIQGQGQPIRLTSDSNTQMYVRYQNQNSTDQGIRVGNDSTSPYNGDNFTIQWDSGADTWGEIFRVSGSGETFMVGLDNTTTVDTLYYNTSTGEVTYGAGADTGSFFTSASVDYNRVTFTSGDGTISTITIDTGSFEPDRQDTGSFFTSASVDLNTITFHYGDTTSGSLSVDTGSHFISNVELNPNATGSSLIFTGEGGAFNGAIDLSKAYQQGGGMTLNYSGSILFNAASDWTGGAPNRKVSSTVTSMRDAGWNEWRFSDISRNFSSQYHNNNYNESVFDLIANVVNHTGQLIVRVYDDRNSAYEGFYMNSGSAFIRNNAGGAGDLALYLKHIGGRGFGATSGTPGTNTINNTNVSFTFTGTQLYESGSQSTSAFNNASVDSNILTLTRDDGSREILTIDTGSAVTTDISALNTFTGSIQTEVDDLKAATGSYYVSSSVDLNTITFTQGDGTTESFTVHTGSKATPAGTTTELQFRDTGAFGATTGITYNSSLSRLDLDAASILVEGKSVPIQLNYGSTTSKQTVISYQQSTTSNVGFRVGNNDLGNTGRDIFVIAHGTTNWASSNTTNIFELDQAGDLRLSSYGSGNFTGTATRYLAVDADGNLIEESIPSGGGTVDTGSFYVSSSVDLNTITFTQGDGSTEVVTIHTGSAGGGGGTVDTGSFYVSSSVDLNTITFTQGDGSTEVVTVHTGSGLTGNGSVGQIALWDASKRLNGDGDFVWNPLNNRMGINIASPLSNIHIDGYGQPIRLTSDSNTQMYVRYQNEKSTSEGIRIGNDSTDRSATGGVNYGADNFAVQWDSGASGADSWQEMFRVSSSGEMYVQNLPTSTTANTLYYNTSTGEVTYGAAPSGGGGGTVDTGSFYVGSSVNLNTITFTQGDGTTEVITIDTGSAPSGTDTTIYSTNGTLSGNRTLTGAGNTLSFSGLSGVDLNADTTQLRGQIYLAESSNGNGFVTNATKSDVLYFDSTTGEVTYGAAPSGGSGIALTDLDVQIGSLSPSGSLSYDNTTGTFTFNPATISGGGGSTSPGGSDTEIQYNNGGSFGGSKIYYNDTSETVGINVTPATNRALSIQGSTGITLKSISTQTSNRIQLINASSHANGVIFGSTNGNDFHLQQYDSSTLETNLTISNTGETFLPRLASDATPSDIIYYDSTTGELTYGTAPSGGGSTSPGGSTTQVQFNDGGAFGGDAGLVYDKTNDRLGIGGTGTPSNTLHLGKGETPLLLDGDAASQKYQYIEMKPDGSGFKSYRLGAGYSSFSPTADGFYFDYTADGSTWNNKLRLTGVGGQLTLPGYAGTSLAATADTSYILSSDSNGKIWKVPLQYDQSAGAYGIGTTPSSAKLQVNGTVGTGGVSIYASHDIVAYSDARSKVNVETIPNALEKVNAVRGVTYNKVEDPEGIRYMGVIAQELLEHLPEVVHQGEEGNYSVAYGNVVGVLIEAVKELTAKVEDLESRLGK